MSDSSVQKKRGKGGSKRMRRLCLEGGSKQERPEVPVSLFAFRIFNFGTSFTKKLNHHSAGRMKVKRQSMAKVIQDQLIVLSNS